jgi:hypothetical protein
MQEGIGGRVTVYGIQQFENTFIQKSTNNCYRRNYPLVSITRRNQAKIF